MKVKFINSIVIGIISMMMISCIPAIKELPQSSQVKVPQKWHEAMKGETTVIEEKWWNQFNDPVLSDLVNQGLANNIDLAIAKTHVEQALAQEKISRSMLFPNFELNGPITRARNINAFGQQVITRVEQPIFQTSYELDLFGKNFNSHQASKLSAQAQKLTAESVQISIVSTIIKSYITLRALDEKLALLNKTLESRKGALAIAQKKANVGYTSKLELDQALAEYSGTLQQIPSVKMAISQQEHALSMLLGSTSDSIPRGKSLNELNHPLIPEMLPAEVMQKRPDITAASLQLAASDKMLSSAQAQFFPSVRISATLGKLFTTAPIEEPVKIWSIGGSILAPLFEGGRLKGEFANASSKRDEAALNYKKVVLNAFKEVEDQIVSGYLLQDQTAALIIQDKALTNALYHANNRYQAGYSSYLEVLDSQRNLLTVQAQVIQNKADYLNSLVNLYQALGGGWIPEK